MKVRVILFTPL